MHLVVWGHEHVKGLFIQCVLGEAVKKNFFQRLMISRD